MTTALVAGYTLPLAGNQNPGKERTDSFSEEDMDNMKELVGISSEEIINNIKEKIVNAIPFDKEALHRSKTKLKKSFNGYVIKAEDRNIEEAKLPSKSAKSTDKFTKTGELVARAVEDVEKSAQEYDPELAKILSSDMSEIEKEIKNSGNFNGVLGDLNAVFKNVYASDDEHLQSMLENEIEKLAAENPDYEDQIDRLYHTFKKHEEAQQKEMAEQNEIEVITFDALRLKCLPFIKIYIDSYLEWIEKNDLKDDYFTTYGNNPANFLKLLSHDEVFLQSKKETGDVYDSFVSIVNEKIKNSPLGEIAYRKIAPRSHTLISFFQKIGEDFKEITEKSTYTTEKKKESGQNKLETIAKSLNLSIGGATNELSKALGKTYVHYLIQDIVSDPGILRTFISEKFRVFLKDKNKSRRVSDSLSNDQLEREEMQHIGGNAVIDRIAADVESLNTSLANVQKKLAPERSAMIRSITNKLKDDFDDILSRTDDQSLYSAALTMHTLDSLANRPNEIGDLKNFIKALFFTSQDSKHDISDIQEFLKSVKPVVASEKDMHGNETGYKPRGVINGLITIILKSNDVESFRNNFFEAFSIPVHKTKVATAPVQSVSNPVVMRNINSVKEFITRLRSFNPLLRLQDFNKTAVGAPILQAWTQIENSLMSGNIDKDSAEQALISFKDILEKTESGINNNIFGYHTNKINKPLPGFVTLNTLSAGTEIGSKLGEQQRQYFKNDEFAPLVKNLQTLRARVNALQDAIHQQ